MPVSLSEEQFFAKLDRWLDPQKSSAILCRNVVDIMRFRIFFHGKLFDRRKSFFNVQFLTPDQLLKKSMPGINTPENFLHHTITLKIFLHSCISELKSNIRNPVISTLLEMPNFTRELPFLWHLYLWGRNLGYSYAQDRPGSELASSLLELFGMLDEKLAGSGRLVIQQILQSSGQIWKPDSHCFDQIICLYPSRFNPLDTLKMHFLTILHPSLWKFVYAEGQDQTFNEDLTRSLPGHRGNRISVNVGNFESYSISSEQNPQSPYIDWKRQNKNFFDLTPVQKFGYENKIWMSRTSADEAHLLAVSIRRLVDSGIEPQNIFILYSSKSDLPLMEYACRSQGIQINHPEKINAANRPVISLILDLLDLLGIRKTHTLFTRNRLIDLIKNPCLDFPERDQNPGVLKELEQYILNNFLQSDIILPHEIRTIGLIKKWSGNGLVRIGEMLTRDLQAINVEQNFHFKITLLKNIVRAYLAPDVFTGLDSRKRSNSNQVNLWKGQWSELEKILVQFSLLEFKISVMPETPDLFDILYEEISNIKLNYRDHKALKIDFPEIYARSVKEGLHSPVDYLFICGLTSQNFPVTENYISYLYPEITGKSLLELATHDQIYKIRESFALVRRGTALTFNLEKDPAPSDLIFDLMKNQGCHFENKKEILAELPVFSKQQDNPAIDGLKSPLKFTNFSSSGCLMASFDAKIRNFDAPDYRTFTGLTAVTSFASIASAGRVESFAACPQMYWFRYILELGESVDYMCLNKIDRRVKGILFHEFSGRLMKYLIEHYYGLTYGKLQSRINSGELSHIFRMCLESVCDEFLKSSNMDYKTLTTEILGNLGSEFSLYFKKFFYSAERETHPFSDQYPVAVEQSFDRISLGGMEFTGRIDRLDYSPRHKILTVIDYKTSSSGVYDCDIEKIRTLARFQLPLYALALQSILPGLNTLSPESVEFYSGAYEMIRTGKEFPEIYFMEIDSGSFFYTHTQLHNKLGALVEPGFALIKNIFNDGYFFAVGHKKNMDIENEWDAPCKYCSYTEICDKLPFDTMINRLGHDEMGKAFLLNFLKNSSAVK